MKIILFILLLSSCIVRKPSIKSIDAQYTSVHYEIICMDKRRFLIIKDTIKPTKLYKLAFNLCEGR